MSINPTSTTPFFSRETRNLILYDRSQNDTRSVARQQPRTIKHDPTLPKFAASNMFLKATMYANSYLPPQLPPFRVYISTWPLLCVAAGFSRDAYKKPRGAERKSFVDADCKLGTNAMVIKSVPIDSMKRSNLCDSRYRQFYGLGREPADSSNIAQRLP